LLRRHLNGKTRRYARAIWFRLSEPLARAFAEAPPPPKVAAKGVYCLDVETRSALLAKNASFKFPPASTIKLATALVLIRTTQGDLGRPVTIEPRDCVGDLESRMRLRAGDVVTHDDLLHGLMLASGNDAAKAIARSIGGELLEEEGGEGDPVARFVQAMNRLAASLNLSRTRFVNPSGLPVTGQYSTARDLTLLGAEAFSESVIREVSQKRTHVVETRGPCRRRIEIGSTMQLLGEEGIVCGKTGTTEEGEASLVLYSLLAGRPVVTALVASWTSTRYADARRILDRLARSDR